MLRGWCKKCSHYTYKHVKCDTCRELVESETVAKSSAGTQTSANIPVATRSVRPASFHSDVVFEMSMEITTMLRDVCNSERVSILRAVCDCYGIESKGLRLLNRDSVQ